MPKKSDGKAARRFWNKREEEFLLNTMKDLVIENPMWKLDCGMFKGGFFKECEKKIILRFPGTDLRASPHIDSKIKTWRKQYNLLQDMIKSSGFGWDDSEKMVLVDSDESVMELMLYSEMELGTYAESRLSILLMDMER
ncbi:hypothetical protein RHGRI_005111 [Rhododendron griersonianum]|uniref:Myb/SANT-like domain-containing protein n=1 Tax=Rhododendron griersonianum TaxID=479676 RepID=A0AAV6LDS8_9ERIC|nr:hypothetical protein RHGRI_005111 [Rhododendron griersonianum]